MCLKAHLIIPRVSFFFSFSTSHSPFPHTVLGRIQPNRKINSLHIILGSTFLPGQSLASSVVNPDVIMPPFKHRASLRWCVIALSSAGFFKLGSNWGSTLHPFLVWLRTTINLPSYQRILIKTRMIGPQPRTSHRNREARERKKKMQQKNILTWTEWGAGFQCTGCGEVGLRHVDRVVWGMSIKKIRRGEKGKKDLSREQYGDPHNWEEKCVYMA